MAVMTVRKPKKRREKGKIVFANGVFDLLHPGHISLLKFAGSLGDTLIVGLNSDVSTKLLKGPARPIHDQERRKDALLRTGLVDEVVIFDEMRTNRVVREIMPHIIVKGAEHVDMEALIRKNDDVPDEIEIVVCPVLNDERGEKISTTALIAKASKKNKD